MSSCDWFVSLSRVVHPCFIICQNFRTILLRLKIFILCISHILLIHLSADGHLGCFHLLAIVNAAALKRNFKSGILDHTIICLIFWTNHPSQFFTVATFCISTSSAQGFWCFHGNHPNRYDLITHQVLICTFLIINDDEHISMCLLAICAY